MGAVGQLQQTRWQNDQDVEQAKRYETGQASREGRSQEERLDCEK